jgi:hypothetical protein
MLSSLRYLGIFIMGMVLFFGSINSAGLTAKVRGTPTSTLTAKASATVSRSKTITTSPTSIPTQTQTATRTPEPTLTATLTATASATLTATATPVPTATPVQRVELLLFENQRLWSGQILTSNVIDVRNYKEATLFLSTKFEPGGSYPGNYGTCYFIPENGTPEDRYKGTILSITTKYEGGIVDQQTVSNGKIIGPKLVCEVVNGSA